MIALGVVVIDELTEAAFQIGWQAVAFQQYLFLPRAIPTLDLSLRNQVILAVTAMADTSLVKPVLDFG